MRIVKKAVALAAASVLVMGCSTYREYVRPDIPAADSLFAAVGEGSVAELSWRDFFTDPCLQSLIEEGLANNADLASAALKVEQAQAALEMAAKAFLPGFDFAPSVSTGRVSLPVTASWEVDFGGRLLNSRRKAQAELERSEMLRRTVQTELVAGIAELYYGLLKLDAQLLVSGTTAESWKENVAIMKAMKEAGMTNEASVSQTEANSCSVEASVYDLRYSIVQMENALGVLLGVPSRHFERTSINETSLPGVTGTGVPAEMLSRRPDVLAAELSLRSAFYDTQMARAAFYPSLNISGQAGWEKVFTAPSEWILSLGASALQPIFAKGRLKAGLAQATSRQEEALVNFRQTLLEAGAQVRDALALCESAESKTDVRLRQIAALENAEQSTVMLFRHSGSTYLEVLTAQQSLLSARLQQIADRYDALRGSVALYKALGGGAE